MTRMTLFLVTLITVFLWDLALYNRFQDDAGLSKAVPSLISLKNTYILFN